jgi:serine/threonine-protein kinase
MIFSTPNHLQGYMLSVGDGTRLDAGPQAIVKDPNRFSGSFDIVNGISCMGCHKHGIIPFKDALRQSFVGRPGEVAAKVLQLFPEQQVLDKVVQQDQQRFLAALDQAIGPFLRSSDADKRDVRDFPEPITAVSKRYGHPVNLERVAAELGLPPTDQEIIETGIRASAAEFKTAIRVSEALRKIELGALASDESLTREQWEKVYQRAARELGIGIPVTIR